MIKLLCSTKYKIKVATQKGSESILIPNKNGILEYCLEPLDSDFKMIFKQETKGKNNNKFWKETIEYNSKIDKKVYKYTVNYGKTILELMNNYEEIIKIFWKSDRDFQEMDYEDYDKALEILNELKKELLKYKSIYVIFCFNIDMFITRLEEERKNKVEGPQVSCLDFIMYITHEINMVRLIIERSYIKIEGIEGDFYFKNKKYTDIRQLRLPPVKVTYSQKINLDGENENKYEIDEYHYDIYSLNNLVDVSLYHINQNEKAILKCAYCKKYFIPREHTIIKDTKDEINVKKTIDERTTKVFCSDKCKENFKSKVPISTPNDNTVVSKDYGDARKNLRDRLRQKDNRRKKKGLKELNLLKKFDEKEKKTKNELIERYGKNNNRIEFELLKLIRKENEKLNKYMIRK